MTTADSENPEIPRESSSFESLGLDRGLLRAATEMGFAHPTPVQARAIPPAIAGSDVLGSAQTGSGKTVAFVLPLLQHLLRQPVPGKGIRGVILVPTRELAAQVEATFLACGQFSGIRCALIIGGASWNTQVANLKAGASVVVATPGRLLDHLHNNRAFSLSECRFLVLDEADRMLDMGFLPDIRAILEKIPRQRQTLMFSATIPPEIERLVSQFMRDPVRVQIDPPRAPAKGIKQHVYPVSPAQKYALLLALLSRPEVTSSLVFTATKRAADIVGGYLKSKGLSAAILHADLSQSHRTQAMEGFRDRRHAILVATDIAARGIDVRHVSHVFNFDVPLYAEDYLHRIGRTARAFTVGQAITLMTPVEKKHVASIETFIQAEIPRCALDGFPYDVPPRLEAFKASLQSRFRLPRRSRRSGRRGLM